MSRYKNLLFGMQTLLLTVVFSAASVTAQAVTHAYTADASIQRGMIVSLDDKDKTKISPLKSDDIDDMEGVVVAANDAPVTISSADTTKQQVFVATTGRYKVLVSNQNGPIKAGSYVTISSLGGIGMAAGKEQALVVGKAIEGFDGKTNTSGTAKLKDADDREISVAIGMIGVEIDVSHNPLEAREQTAPSIILGFLQAGARAVVNKPVDPARLYIGALVLVLTTAIAGSILYAGVRSSMVSIGRNPLAKKSIVGNLIQIVLISIIILIIGVVGVYLLLKL